MGQIDADLRAHLVAIYRRMCAAMLVTALVALVFGVELAAFSRGAPTASRSGLPPRDGADLKLGPQVSWHLQIRK